MQVTLSVSLGYVLLQCVARIHVANNRQGERERERGEREERREREERERREREERRERGERKKRKEKLGV